MKKFTNNKQTLRLHEAKMQKAFLRVINRHFACKKETSIAFRKKRFLNGFIFL